MKTIAILLLLALLSGCVSDNSSWKVRRIHALGDIQGKTYVLAPANPDLLGNPEFTAYAKLTEGKISQHHAIRRPFDELGKTDLLFILDYGAEARDDVFIYAVYGNVVRPPSEAKMLKGQPSEMTNDVVGIGTGAITRFPHYVRILVFDGRSVLTGKPVQLYEGRAQTENNTKNLAAAVPRGIDALFDDFPGKSGSTTSKYYPPTEANPSTPKAFSLPYEGVERNIHYL